MSGLYFSVCLDELLFNRNNNSSMWWWTRRFTNMMRAHQEPPKLGSSWASGRGSARGTLRTRVPALLASPGFSSFLQSSLCCSSVQVAELRSDPDFTGTDFSLLGSLWVNQRQPDGGSRSSHSPLRVEKSRKLILSQLSHSRRWKYGSHLSEAVAQMKRYRGTQMANDWVD